MAVNRAGYGDDLAYIHDVGYGGFADGAAAGLVEILQQRGIGGGLVVDLGCGSGIWARRLVDHGYQVLGVDLSPAMIELARRRVPEAEFRQASFLQYPIPPCRAVTSLGEVFGYLFDRSNDSRALRRVCQRIYHALEPGGVLVFDLAEVGLDRHRPPTFREGDDWACLVRFEYLEPQQQLVRHIVTFRKSGQLYRRQAETHWVQLYEGKAVVAMLRQLGFRVRVQRRYGTYPLLRGRIAFVANKPGNIPRSTRSQRGRRSV